MTTPGGYMIEYLLQTNVPGADGENDWDAIVRDFMPPQIMSRWRTATNGKLSGKRTRLGMNVEQARMSSFITEEHIPQLDLVQWDGDYRFHFYSVMLNDKDATAWGEYHQVTGEVSDVETQPTQADGGQNYTYGLYVSQWTFRQVPPGEEPIRGWIAKHFNYNTDKFFERKLSSGTNNYGHYVGAQIDNPLDNPSSFREMVKDHNILLGRTP